MSTTTKPTRAKQEPPELARQVAEMKRKQTKQQADEHAADRLAMDKPVPPLAKTSELGTVKATCGACKKSFRASFLKIEGVVVSQMKVCEKCLSAQNLEAELTVARERRQALDDEINRVIPEDYRESDVSKLIRDKKLDAKEVAKITDWSAGPRGLGVIGLSRKGKTRIVFQLIRRLIEEGRRVLYVNAVTFADDLGMKFSARPEEGFRFIERLCNVEILFLDDIGKERLTDRVEAAYYRIIEERGNRRRPLIFTANQNGEQLKRKMTNDEGEPSDRAVPIVERLREKCEIVVL